MCSTNSVPEQITARRTYQRVKLLKFQSRLTGPPDVTVDVNHYPRDFKNCCSVFLNVCYSQDGVAAQIAALLTNMEVVNHKTQIIL